MRGIERGLQVAEHEGDAGELPAAGLLKILAHNTFCAAMFAALLALQAGWVALLSSFLIASLYANVIGTAAHLVLPHVATRLGCRGRAVYWLGISGALVALAVAGSLVAGAVAGALGLLGPRPWWPAALKGLGFSVVLTLGVGVLITMYETTRSRLNDARESLRIRELEIERAQRLATDARLASLESRLHPHFLFNAIAAIAGQVREAPEHAERLLVEFADLLRASLDSTNRHTVPLADEVAIVRGYLEIEQARLGERLRCKLDVPDELGTWPVPPLALHTLVQNSVKHVAAARSAGAEIRIDARRIGDRLALAVADDGPGFDLLAAPAGHGLDTLRARLAVVFGVDATLEATRADGGGCVRMWLPSRVALGDQR
jgi:Histidine kinase